jgi:hypothetical protein
MQCPECGTPVTDDNRFCTQCGAQLYPSPVETQTDSGARGIAAPSTTGSRRDSSEPRRGRVFIITGAFWILASLAAALLWKHSDGIPVLFLASVVLNGALLSAVLSSLFGMPTRAGLLGLFAANLAACVAWGIARALLLLAHPDSDVGKLALGIAIPGLVALLVAVWYSRLIMVVVSAGITPPGEEGNGDDQGE